MTVKESTPLLQAEGGDIGETMMQAQIADLPLEDGNPFILAHLAPGAVFTGNPQFTLADRSPGARGALSRLHAAAVLRNTPYRRELQTDILILHDGHAFPGARDASRK